MAKLQPEAVIVAVSPVVEPFELLDQWRTLNEPPEQIARRGHCRPRRRPGREARFEADFSVREGYTPTQKEWRDACETTATTTKMNGSATSGFSGGSRPAGSSGPIHLMRPRHRRITEPNHRRR
jgi:hypothetical protein